MKYDDDDDDQNEHDWDHEGWSHEVDDQNDHSIWRRMI